MFPGMDSQQPPTPPVFVKGKTNWLALGIVLTVLALPVAIVGSLVAFSPSMHPEWQPRIADILDGKVNGERKRDALEYATTRSDHLLKVDGFTYVGSTTDAVCDVLPGDFGQGHPVECSVETRRMYGFSGDFEQMRERALDALDHSCEPTSKRLSFLGWVDNESWAGIWDCATITGAPPTVAGERSPGVRAVPIFYREDKIASSTEHQPCRPASQQSEQDNGGRRCFTATDPAKIARGLSGASYLLTVTTSADFYHGWEP